MSAQWDRGVLTMSSWHGLETIGTMLNAAAQIAAGESSGAWPVALRDEEVRTVTGLACPVKAIVGSYRYDKERVLGVVGEHYTAATPESWRALCEAACAAGAQATGAFSLRGGSRVVATFAVCEGSEIATNLLLADSFDGSLALTSGTTSVRVVCANTLAVALRGHGLARLRHTRSLPDKVALLQTAIGDAIETGRAVSDRYRAAVECWLSREREKEVFDALFPAAAEDASRVQRTRAENIRADARRACTLPMNRERSSENGSLATLWNAATWLVDRDPDGASRECRGGADRLDSMLFGQRAVRVKQIEQIMVDVLMKDGTVRPMPVDHAVAAGVSTDQMGAGLLASMLD